MRLALLSEPRFPQGLGDDQPLVDALRRRGVTVEHAVWSDDSVQWPSFDAALIRATWDYFRHLPAFLDRLRELDAAGVEVINPVDVVGWNADKHYLLDLAEEGVAISPTERVECGSELLLADAMERLNTGDAVLKPAVSGGGWRTARVERADVHRHEPLLRTILADGDALLQAFQPEVARDGELSLVFFGGEYSHTCRKRAKAGEFRVQEDHGGTVHPEQPGAAAIEQAAEVLSVARRVLQAKGMRQTDQPLVYARVDGVLDDGGRFILMELELIEPELFFRIRPDSGERMAEVLLDRLSDSR